MSDTLLTAFTGVVALAILLYSLTLLAMYRQMKMLSQRFDSLSRDMSRRVEGVTGKVDEIIPMVKATMEKVRAVEDDMIATSRVVHNRILEIDAFLGETTEVARLQVARLQDVVETSSARINETFDILQRTILVPANEVNAIYRGVQTAIDVLFGRRRGPSSQSTHDEEMFI